MHIKCISCKIFYIWYFIIRELYIWLRVQLRTSTRFVLFARNTRHTCLQHPALTRKSEAESICYSGLAFIQRYFLKSGSLRYSTQFFKKGKIPDFNSKTTSLTPKFYSIKMLLLAYSIIFMTNSGEPQKNLIVNNHIYIILNILAQQNFFKIVNIIEYSYNAKSFYEIKFSGHRLKPKYPPLLP
jgi:hypothetical protein